MSAPAPVVPSLEYLMRVRIAAEAPLTLGGPWGERRLVPITGGEFSGPRLQGRVLAGGGDWLVQRSDGCFQLDARYTLETNDGALIYVQDRGLRHGPPKVMARLAQGEAVAPDEYCFRNNAVLETAAEDYAWLNQLVIIGSGMRGPDGVVIEFYAVA